MWSDSAKDCDLSKAMYSMYGISWPPAINEFCEIEEMRLDGVNWVNAPRFLERIAPSSLVIISSACYFLGSRSLLSYQPQPVD